MSRILACNEPHGADRVTEPSADAAFQKQLNAGAGSLALLARLVAAGEPRYGYDLAAELDDVAGPLPMTAGSLYPALRSLERRGLLTSQTRLSDEGRARRYYEPTDAGRAALADWRAAWAETVRFVESALSAGGSSAPSGTPLSETSHDRPDARRPRRRAVSRPDDGRPAGRDA